MSWPGLPVLVKVTGQPVILLGEGEAADAKRRVLERAGARVVTDHPDARLAIVAIEEDAAAVAAVERLRARGVLVNAVDRPTLCDFTLPAVVDRSPVLIAVATGGVSAGLAAAVRQRLEALLPANLGRLADALFAARDRLRAALPDGGERRRAIGAALAGELNPLDGASAGRVEGWLDDLTEATAVDPTLVPILLRSPDPDDLTLREARWLALADRVFHPPDIPAAMLERARADAARIACDAPPGDELPGLSVWVGWA
ncbi:MAG: siroheme synthase [Sphingomonas bacterium]|uniref:precorrin-2 dehydrogenase/sirohydrochlorin ferrochelatase family protein n=1 Tax=Sphingomonas bacterium TaxID=1895847 RepID=UPI0026139F55|nr:NAD(P)-dependent oxidoreductase [Sphingomonas bacterium]MDB5694843.1 siroheme synthase [Sphingomonas bacterium]